jgi:membrane-associated phospholipid phosphatase
MDQERVSVAEMSGIVTTAAVEEIVRAERGLVEVLREAARFAFRPTRRNVLHWASWALALGVELMLVVVLRDGVIHGWEQSVTRAFQEGPRRRLIFDITSTMTNVISMTFLWIFLAIVGVALRLGHRGAAILLVLTFPLHILAQFPKALVDRPRPSSEFAGIAGVGGFQSFPSGHADYAVTFYGFLAYLLMLHTRSHRRRIAIFVLWLLFVLATGFGRIALGRHWALDVLTAYLIGLGLLSGLIWLHSAFRYVKEGRVPGGSPNVPGPAAGRSDEAW